MVQQGGTETQNDFNPQGTVLWGHMLTTMLFGNEMCLVHLCTGKLQKLQVTWLRLSAQELNSVSNSLSQHRTAHFVGPALSTYKTRPLQFLMPGDPREQLSHTEL